MIAKRVMRKGTGDFARLGRYIVDARGLIDPASWTRTADYILDTAHDGAKVGGVRVTNCGSDDPAFATAEILATQQLNTRSKADKSYHLVVSFPAGERPALDVLNQIEDALVEAIGLADHQRISAIHTDTEHLHIHVAINKVHPETHRNVEPYYDKRALMEACERLEVIHNLQRTNHGLEHDQEREHERGRTGPDHGTGHDGARTEGVQIDYESLGGAHDGDRNAALRQSYRAALAEDDEAQSLDAVRDLSGVSVVRDTRAAHELLPGAENDNLDEHEATRPDLLRRVRNGDSGHAGQARRVDGRAGDMEAHAGREALLRWVSTHAKEGMQQAGSWEELHAGLAELGLQIKPRGAGIVVATTDGKAMVRASDVARDLSKAGLEARLGPFVPPSEAVKAIKPRMRYHAPARHRHRDTAGLFSSFRKERNAAIAARKQLREQLRKKHEAEQKALQKRYATRRAAVKLASSALDAGKMSHHEKTGLRTARGAVRVGSMAKTLGIKDQYSAIARERKREQAELKLRQRRERDAVVLRHPLPVWQAWLAGQASAGNTSALDVLRSQERKKEKFLGSWINALDAEAAKTVVYNQMKPRTDKSGAVVYNVADGGRVKDTRNGVKVEASTDAAAFLGLVLAADRYAGQALVVQGSTAFKEQLAAVAGAKNLDIRFADPGMEAARQKASQPAPVPTKPTPAAAPEKPTLDKPAPAKLDALDVYISQRNQQREQTSSISYHRRWEASDAGTAVYQGRRKFTDGSEAVLLERGGDTVVMPVTSAQAAKASTWRIGTAVATDNRGRFVDAQKTQPTIKKGKSR